VCKRTFQSFSILSFLDWDGSSLESQRLPPNMLRLTNLLFSHVLTNMWSFNQIQILAINTFSWFMLVTITQLLCFEKWRVAIIVVQWRGLLLSCRPSLTPCLTELKAWSMGVCHDNTLLEKKIEILTCNVSFQLEDNGKEHDSYWGYIVRYYKYRKKGCNGNRRREINKR